VQKFPESVIREMTRIAAIHDAVNLSQGYPDFDPPRELTEAAKRALDGGYNQYSITWGARELRDAIARRAKAFNGIDADPETNLVVTCGATEAMMAAMLSLINPGDEAVIFEPFYENYGPDAIVSGARPRYVRMEWPDWTVDEEELKAAFTDRTKFLILNTPNNPTGKVFGRPELKLIADLCTDHNAVAVTDEIYEHIVFDGAKHVSLAAIGDMSNRTITINGLSKTYSATGWRIGWAIAPKTLAHAMRRTHDFLTVGAPHPLQMGRGPRHSGRADPRGRHRGPGESGRRPRHPSARPSRTDCRARIHRCPHPHGRQRGGVGMDEARRNPLHDRGDRPASEGCGPYGSRSVGHRRRLGRSEVDGTAVPHARRFGPGLEGSRGRRPPNRLSHGVPEFRGA